MHSSSPTLGWMRPFGQTGGMKLITGLLFVALGLYCAFGFLHSFEPTDDALVWRVGYGAAVLLCAWRASRLLRR